MEKVEKGTVFRRVRGNVEPLGIVARDQVLADRGGLGHEDVAVDEGRHAVRDQEYIKQYVAEVLESREMVYRAFDRMGIRYFPSRANFVLFHAGDRALAIRDALRERGVLVRDRSYEIPGCVRVTLGTRFATDRFLAELDVLWTA